MTIGKKRRDTIELLVYTLIFACFIIAGFYVRGINKKENELLDKHGVSVFGKIYHMRGGTRGMSVKYYFKVDDRTFKGLLTTYKKGICVGQKYEVEYLPTNPEINRINLNKELKLMDDVAVLKDSFEIRYLFMSFEDEGKLYLTLTPKDTSIAKIYNNKQFGVKDWKQRHKFIQSQVQAMKDAANSENIENIEKYFDVFLFYTRREYLYKNDSTAVNVGNVHPDYSVSANAPMEIFRLDGGKWVLDEYIPNKNGSTNKQYGIDRANKILKERFGKMAEEMERDKQNN